jgi:hypothetical protein
MGTKPTQHSRVELLTSRIHRTAMTSKRYLPQNYFSRVVGTNPFGLLGRNVVISQPVYQENWYAASNHRSLGRGIRQVDAASQTPVYECRFHCWAKNDSTEPRSRVKELAHSHVCNLAEAGERRFGDDCTEAIFFFNGLKQNSRTHRFAHPENALGVLLHHQPVEPEMHVPALL